MTEMLYYQDTKMSEFEARVVGAVKEEKTWRVVLDKTCFYPEGGGQPADKGWINHIPVLDVRKENGIIYHFLPENPGEGVIRGKINVPRRRDFMQQHTGQHIISGALWKVGKYKTVSVHMGTDYTTIETGAPGIPAEDVISAETLANRVIREDLPLSFIHTGHRELDQFPLRKPCNREGSIRLVRIGDFDCVACGGLHLESTHQVGWVKSIGIEKIRGHVRIAWKIGDRVFEDYREKDKIISEVRTVLATRNEDMVKKTREIQEELLDMKRKCSWFENRLADTITRNLVGKQDDPGKSGLRIITDSWKEEDGNLLKKIVKNLLKEEKILICLVNILDGKVMWSIGCSGDINFPFTGIKGELLPIIDGRGGGRSPLWQGMGLKPEGAGDFLAAFRGLALELDL